METLAHLSRTSALEDAKDLLKAGVDGFVHTVRDRDVDAEYIALVKAHPKVWTGPNIPGRAKPRKKSTSWRKRCRRRRSPTCAGRSTSERAAEIRLIRSSSFTAVM